MRLDYTGIAQREEQQIFNLKVIGSSPIIRTKRQVQQVKPPSSVSYNKTKSHGDVMTCLVIRPGSSVGRARD